MEPKRPVSVNSVLLSQNKCAVLESGCPSVREILPRQGCRQSAGGTTHRTRFLDEVIDPSTPLVNSDKRGQGAYIDPSHYTYRIVTAIHGIASSAGTLNTWPRQAGRRALPRSSSPLRGNRRAGFRPTCPWSRDDRLTARTRFPREAATGSVISGGDLSGWTVAEQRPCDQHSDAEGKRRTGEVLRGEPNVCDEW